MFNGVKRYALVRGNRLETVASYLPANYKVLGNVVQEESWGGPYPALVICGEDFHGWTLDKYVIPRLGSGLYAATEIDLSHPAMKQIPM